MTRGLRNLVISALACVVLTVSASDARHTDAQARRSGATYMSRSLQAMQSDPAINPAMLWVKQGEELWRASAQAGDQASSSCSACHGDASLSMQGVATRYPAFDEGLQHPVNLAQRVNQCRIKHQKREPWRLEGTELLAVESYVAFQSRGMPLKPVQDDRLKSFVQRGAQRYGQRLGQINLSCAQCHDERAGLRLGGNLIPQAHPTGYPLYRLEWQSVGSLQRRIRNCMTGVRAQPFPLGATELLELELFLADRSAGMPLEAPGVRP